MQSDAGAVPAGSTKSQMPEFPVFSWGRTRIDACRKRETRSGTASTLIAAKPQRVNDNVPFAERRIAA